MLKSIFDFLTSDDNVIDAEFEQTELNSDVDLRNFTAEEKSIHSEGDAACSMRNRPAPNAKKAY